MDFSHIDTWPGHNCHNPIHYNLVHTLHPIDQPLTVAVNARLTCASSTVVSMVGRCTQLELKTLLEVWMVQVLSQPEMARSLKTGEWGIYAGKTTGAHDCI